MKPTNHTFIMERVNEKGWVKLRLIKEDGTEASCEITKKLFDRNTDAIYRLQDDIDTLLAEAAGE